MLLPLSISLFPQTTTTLSYAVIHLKPPQTLRASTILYQIPSNSNGSREAVNTAQPDTITATTISEPSANQLIRIEDREEDIDPDYMHYLRAIGAYDSVQPQSARGKCRDRNGPR
ncbi:hypothetical protein YC2023_041971 [Brassica napus]